MKNTKRTEQIPMANEKTKPTNSNLGIEDISTLLETLEKHEVTEFKLEREGEKVWLKRGPQNAVSPVTYQMAPAQGYPHTGYNVAPNMGGQQVDPQQGTAASPSLTVVQNESPIAAAGKNLKEIRSPMVGTFYRRPAVDADSYVSVGDNVKKGDILCIVEAMKLMNEIESEISGKIAEICLEDGQMVEYGEVLFKVEIS